MFGRSKKAEGIDALLPDEPSGKNYFLEKGFSDLGGTVRESFEANRKTASKSFGSITGSKYTGAGKAAMGVLYFCAGIAVAVFGTMLTLLISVVHSTIVFVIMLVVYAGLGLSKLIDGIYRHCLRSLQNQNRASRLSLSSMRKNALQAEAQRVWDPHP